MIAHSPLPWRLEKSHDNSWNGAYIIAADGSIVARLTRNADKHIETKRMDGDIIISSVNSSVPQMPEADAGNPSWLRTQDNVEVPPQEEK